MGFRRPKYEKTPELATPGAFRPQGVLKRERGIKNQAAVPGLQNKAPGLEFAHEPAEPSLRETGVQAAEIFAQGLAVHLRHGVDVAARRGAQVPSRVFLGLENDSLHVHRQAVLMERN